MWYSKYSWLRVFTPLSWVLSKLVEHRRSRYSKNTKRVWNAPVPVCVVGNITVGGTGKTPLVIWLSQWLIHRGFRVGIVSRGYGSKASSYPISVTERSRCQEVGEENMIRNECVQLSFCSKTMPLTLLFQTMAFNTIDWDATSKSRCSTVLAVLETACKYPLVRSENRKRDYQRFIGL